MSEGIGTFTAAFFYEALLPHFGLNDYNFTVSEAEEGRVRIDSLIVDDAEMEEGWLADLAVTLKGKSLVPAFIARYYRITPHLGEASWTEVPYEDEAAASKAVDELMAMERRGVCRIYKAVSSPEGKDEEAWTAIVELEKGLFPYRSVGFAIDSDYMDVGKVSADQLTLKAACEAAWEYRKRGADITGIYVCIRETKKR